MEHPPSNGSKVILMIYYGGTIQPRLRRHGHSYSYIGGVKKILIVDRNIKFTNLIREFSSMAFSDVCFKYQYPGEDLDSLISVYNEEDLDHMMFEYDHLCRISPESARLRVFLFPVPDNNNDVSSDSLASAMNLEQFVDLLNSVYVSPLEDSSPPYWEDVYPLPPPPPKKNSSPPTPPLEDLTPPPPPPSKNAVKKTEMSKEFHELNIMNDGFDKILKYVMKCFKSVAN